MKVGTTSYYSARQEERNLSLEIIATGGEMALENSEQFSFYILISSHEVKKTLIVRVSLSMQNNNKFNNYFR